METSIAQARRVLCPGCPVYPHIPDEEFHFPSCELCHWPAIGVGPVHIWRCAYCRHRNEHGGVRPRVTTALLRLADVGTAARRLEVADPLYGHYLIARPRPGPCQPRPPGRTQRAVTRSSGPHARVVRHRVPPRARAGRPVYARATVGGLPVLIVGGDRPYPHPLGLIEHDSEPCSLGSRATRIACPCDQPSPCLRGQALYAHVVSLPTATSGPTTGVAAPALTPGAVAVAAWARSAPPGT